MHFMDILFMSITQNRLEEALQCNWGQNWSTHDKFTQIQPWFEGTIFNL